MPSRSPPGHLQEQPNKMPEQQNEQRREGSFREGVENILSGLFRNDAPVSRENSRISQASVSSRGIPAPKVRSLHTPRDEEVHTSHRKTSKGDLLPRQLTPDHMVRYLRARRNSEERDDMRSDDVSYGVERGPSEATVLPDGSVCFASPSPAPVLSHVEEEPRILYELSEGARSVSERQFQEVRVYQENSFGMLDEKTVSRRDVSARNKNANVARKEVSGPALLERSTGSRDTVTVSAKAVTRRVDVEKSTIPLQEQSFRSRDVITDRPKTAKRREVVDNNIPLQEQLCV